MNAVAAAFDHGPSQVGTRLLVAGGLSLALHLLLLLGMQVNPTGGIANVSSTIYARLEPPADETPTETAAFPPEQLQPPPVEQEAVKLASEDPLAAPEPKKPAAPPEQKPEATPPSSPNAGIELPLIRDPTYYTAKQLDAYPQPLTPIRLHYPETAAAERIDGHLRILLLIDEFGVVNEASVVEAEPPGYFEEAARSVFVPARFSPGMKQGRAVKSRVVVQVRYVYGDGEGQIR